MPNRLANAQSPYLRQHQDNPVDWYPWGADAFEAARTHDRPIFLSIGYATCHWCHVMAHESFEDDEVAAALNDTFVCIKVDREERPDVDSIYMNVCQMLNGQGGWPLTVLLTPERKPFYAATYLPKHGRGGRTGLMELTKRVGELWASDREKLVSDADGITQALQQSEEEIGGRAPLDPEVLETAYGQLARRFDYDEGGFGSAPKFPSLHNLLFLLRYGDQAEQPRAEQMVRRTLHAMRRGGLFDQVGYGFHRYATDATWTLPHFEKMLYDQALHVATYAEAYQATGDEAFAKTTRDVITYVLRDLQAPEGGFYSAEDADSLTPEGTSEEGAFYVWTVDEVRDVLDADAADLVIDAYGLTPEGNYRDERTGQRTGANVLHQTAPLDALAARYEMSEDAVQARLDAARAALLDCRAERPRPTLDDKILTDWNGLMIGALARASRILDDPSYADEATIAAHFLLDALRDDEGRLLHRYRDGDAAIRAHLDDYAYLIWGLIALHQTTLDPHWLGEALCLTEEMMDACWDDQQGGFYYTAHDAEALIVRQKKLDDGALPSGNAVAALNLVRLARLTGTTAYAERADTILRFAGRAVRSRPGAFTGMLLPLLAQHADAREIVLAGTGIDPLLAVVHDRYAPHDVVLHRPAGDAPRIAALAPFTDAQRPIDGQPTAYVCRNFACDAPTTDAEALRKQLTP
ncbi:thioredoxin domain-containing protein [Salisaeta longa]|uniref:thioredoxin domain-containing protein n=1 Tax=Salisaeta longa TaxID=503170 RepID=UPI0003B718F5|nr:thioredoxin domain-containing protein [Salisaeta longa]